MLNYSFKVELYDKMLLQFMLKHDGFSTVMLTVTV